jgi:hypothetical protein
LLGASVTRRALDRLLGRRNRAGKARNAVDRAELIGKRAGRTRVARDCANRQRLCGRAFATLLARVRRHCRVIVEATAAAHKTTTWRIDARHKLHDAGRRNTTRVVAIRVGIDSDRNKLSDVGNLVVYNTNNTTTAITTGTGACEKAI